MYARIRSTYWRLLSLPIVERSNVELCLQMHLPSQQEQHLLVRELSGAWPPVLPHLADVHRRGEAEYRRDLNQHYTVGEKMWALYLASSGHPANCCLYYPAEVPTATLTLSLILTLTLSPTLQVTRVYRYYTSATGRCVVAVRTICEMHPSSYWHPICSLTVSP